jgi:hypothetical protein
MKADLLEIMERSALGHPTYVTSVRGSKRDDKIDWSVEIEGWRWWKQTPQEQVCFDERHKAVMRFENLSAGQFGMNCLETNPFDRARDLEDFCVYRLSEHGWAQPFNDRISVTGSVPDPDQLYICLEDHLVAAGSCRTPADFINGGRLSTFRKYASSFGCLLAEGPGPIMAVMRDELERQGARFKVGPCRPYEGEGLLVTWLDTWFTCESAFVEFD